jgi:hypothetical protein
LIISHLRGVPRQVLDSQHTTEKTKFLLTRAPESGSLIAMMKLYPNVNVSFTYQNFGSAWLGVLRGPSEKLQEVFNGLFNYCATNGNMEVRDHLGMLGSFWTSRRAMRRFFFNRYFIPRATGNSGQGKLARTAMRYAWQKLAEMSRHHERFLQFESFAPDVYTNGSICAERPDTDMKDAILSHAFEVSEKSA